MNSSIHGYVSCIIFKVQMGAVRTILRAPGNLTLADLLTKMNSQLTELLQLPLFTGRLTVNMEEAGERESSEKNFG